MTIISKEDRIDVFGSLSSRNLKENSNRDSLVTRLSVRSRCTSSVTVTLCRVVVFPDTVTLKTSSPCFSTLIDIGETDPKNSLDISALNSYQIHTPIEINLVDFECVGRGIED